MFRFCVAILKPINRVKISVEDIIKNFLTPKKNFYLINNSADQYYLGFGNNKIVTGTRLRILGRWEPHCSTAIRALLKPTDNVLQLGSAEGYFSMQIKKNQNENSYLYCVDSDSDKCEILKNNFKKNKFSSYKIFNKKISLENNDMSFISLLEHIENKIDFLFSDIEGFELDLIDEIIKNNIKIKKMVIGFHVEEFKSKKKNYYKEYKFYSYEDLNSRIEKLRKNYKVIFDNDNILCFLRN
jgi:hypothetical protein